MVAKLTQNHKYLTMEWLTLCFQEREWIRYEQNTLKTTQIHNSK